MKEYYKYIEPPKNAPLHAKRIAELLNENGWSQDRFAEEIDISKSSVSNWLQGNIADPRIMNFNRAANALGVSVDYLLGNTDVRTIDSNIQSACDYTGLTEDAVEILHQWNNKTPVLDIEPDMLHLLSSIISNPQFHELMMYIYSVKATTKDISEAEENGSELFARYDLMERVDASLWKSSRIFTDIIEDITSNQKGE